MRFSTFRNFYTGLIFLFASSTVAFAASAITCHCFTDHSYDPARPTVADPYFLATTQNSFFAAVFDIEKKSIVIKKQKGTSADDLWIAYWLAAKSGRDQDALLQDRKNKNNWRQVAAPLAISGKSLGKRVATALKANATDAQLAIAVVDDLLLRYRLHDEDKLAALRQAGASSQEMILTGLIAAKTHQSAPLLYREVLGGGASWGALLQRAKIEPAEIQDEIAVLVKTSKDVGHN